MSVAVVAAGKDAAVPSDAAVGNAAVGDAAVAKGCSDMGVLGVCT